MASVKQIIGVIGISIVLLATIGWWIEKNNPESEVLLTKDTPLEGPLSAEVIQKNNPEITNTMNPIAILQTNKGVIEIELFADTMPITTENFITLANKGFFNDIKFHRVIEGFMIQSGDPNTKSDDVASYGSGGPGYTIQDEFVKGDFLTNVRGTIAMANTGQPNSGGSQFFINTADNTGLDFDKEPFTSKHPVFGRVHAGMDIVDMIEKIEVGGPQKSTPIEPVIIESVTITQQTQ